VTVLKIKPSITLERLDGETIAIDFESGSFFGFRESAADIIWLISERVEVERFFDVIQRHFRATDDAGSLIAQINTFVEDLTNLGIVETGVSPKEGTELDIRTISLPSDYERDVWRSPTIDSNDSLKDLLTIDPIHDVTEGGWPDSRKN